MLALTYFEATHTAQLTALKEYLECQLSGFYPSELESNQCGEIPTVRLWLFYALAAIGILLIALIPVVILGFTVRCTGKPHCCCKSSKDVK